MPIQFLSIAIRTSILGIYVGSLRSSDPTHGPQVILMSLQSVTQEKYLEKGKWDAFSKGSLRPKPCRARANFFLKKKRWFDIAGTPPVIWYGTVKNLGVANLTITAVSKVQISRNRTVPLCRASIEYHSAPSGDSNREIFSFGDQHLMALKQLQETYIFHHFS